MLSKKTEMRIFFTFIAFKLVSSLLNVIHKYSHFISLILTFLHNLTFNKIHNVNLMVENAQFESI